MDAMQGVIAMLAVSGLLAVFAEILIKEPGAAFEIVMDAEVFARRAPRTQTVADPRASWFGEGARSKAVA